MLENALPEGGCFFLRLIPPHFLFASKNMRFARKLFVNVLLSKLE